MWLLTIVKYNINSPFLLTSACSKEIIDVSRFDKISWVSERKKNTGFFLWCCLNNLFFQSFPAYDLVWGLQIHNMLAWSLWPSLKVPTVGTTDTQIRVPSVENPELWKALPLKPWIGQNIAMYASPTAMNVLLVLICTFPAHSPSFVSRSFWYFWTLLVLANAISHFGLWNEEKRAPYSSSQLIDAASPCWVPISRTFEIVYSKSESDILVIYKFSRLSWVHTVHVALGVLHGKGNISVWCSRIQCRCWDVSVIGRFWLGCMCCWLFHVQKCDPAFNLWCSNLCFDLA